MTSPFKEPRRLNPDPQKKTTLAEATDIVKREEEARHGGAGSEDRTPTGGAPATRTWAAQTW